MRITKKIQEKIKRMRGESEDKQAVEWQKMFYFVFHKSFEELQKDNFQDVICEVKKYNSPDYPVLAKIYLSSLNFEGAIVPIFSHRTKGGYYYVIDVCSLQNGKLTQCKPDFKRYLNDKAGLLQPQFISLA